MKLAITHTLSLSLGTPPRALQHLLLTPSATPQQRIERWSIDMPGVANAASFRDGFGNRAHLVNQIKPETDLVISVQGVVDTADRAGVLGKLEYDTPPALYRRTLGEETVDDALVADLRDIADRIARLHELMDRVHALHDAAPASQAQSQSQSQAAVEPPATEPAESPASATIFINAARTLGIPARYVTGYLYDEAASRWHEWAEAWDDGLGWIGFDPALNICPIDSHVRLAAGLTRTGTVPVRSVPALSDAPAETLTIVAS